MCFEAIESLSFADYALVGPGQIFAQGSVDHAAGTLSGKVTFSHPANAGSQGQLFVHARDQFTVTGPIPGELLSITARLQTDGTITITPEPATAFVEAQLSANQGSGWNATNGGIGVTTGSVGGFNQSQSLLQPGSYPYDIEAVSTFDVVTGTSFQLVYAMRLNGNTIDAFPAGDPGNVTLDSLNNASLVFDLQSGYSITSQLGYGVPEPSADFDEDGDKDGFDFLAWQRGFGTDVGLGNVAPLADGNANGDQFIDSADLAIWETQYGTGGAPLASASVVPEPSSLLLASLAGLLFLRARRGP